MVLEPEKMKQFVVTFPFSVPPVVVILTSRCQLNLSLIQQRHRLVALGNDCL